MGNSFETGSVGGRRSIIPSAEDTGETGSEWKSMLGEDLARAMRRLEAAGIFDRSSEDWEGNCWMDPDVARREIRVLLERGPSGLKDAVAVFYSTDNFDSRHPEKTGPGVLRRALDKLGIQADLPPVDQSFTS